MTRRTDYALTPPPGASTPTQAPAQVEPSAGASATASPPGAPVATNAPGASYAQLSYLTDLANQREIGEEAKAALLRRIAVQRELNDKHGDRACPLASPGLTKDRASDFIKRLKDQPYKTRRRSGEPRDIVSEVARDAGHGVPGPDKLPAGHYAIKNAEGQLRFYHVWRAKDKPTFVKLYLIHGQNDTEIKWGHELRAILKAIAEDTLTAARLYGQHIGSCSECGRRLTNRVSRLLSIGPVCGGHHCDPDVWKRMKARARKALQDAGLDPDADVEDTDDLDAIRAAAGLDL
jgi:hypothetical protein